MPPKKKKLAGNTVRALLATVGVDDSAATLGACANLDDEFKLVKSSWHRLVLKNHPDKGGDRQVFEDIQAAFEVLRDMKVNGEVDSFAAAAKGKKSTAKAFQFKQEKTSKQKTASWVRIHSLSTRASFRRQNILSLGEPRFIWHFVFPLPSARARCGARPPRVRDRRPATRCARVTPLVHDVGAPANSSSNLRGGRITNTTAPQGYAVLVARAGKPSFLFFCVTRHLFPQLST